MILVRKYVFVNIYVPISFLWKSISDLLTPLIA